jgi:membrane fusion protein (multidrug efflux system)
MKLPNMKVSNKKACIGLLGLLLIVGCSSMAKKRNQNENRIALPVFRVDTGTVVLTKSFLGTVKGKINVEIRPQVSGQLMKAYVDEGDFVNKGQKLFKINPRTYEQDLNQAKANENVMKAKLANAKLEVERLKPLVEHEVIAPVRLKTAKSEYEIAKANLKRASAKVTNAKIQLGYTTIEAPVSGYIGRIPKRIGNLVNPGDNEPITVLTDVHEVYVYFSINQSDFYNLLKTQQNNTTALKKAVQHIDTNRVVSLILSDGTKYPYKGVIDASSGQVNKNTGSVTMRATFPNKGNMLRSGNTGTVILKKREKGKVIIPRKATYKLQTETFVKKLTPQNRVLRQKITVGTAAPNNRYTVTKGLKIGDRILVEGLEKATDSTRIKPLPYRPDTLMRPKVFPEDYDSSKQVSL